MFTLFTISQAHAFTCGKSQVEVQTEKKVRVDQKIEVQKDWLDMPTRLSIHTGNVSALRLNPKINADTIVLNWVGVTKEVIELNNSENSKYDLGKSFEQFYKKAKYLEFTVLNKKEKVCQQKIMLYGGD